MQPGQVVAQKVTMTALPDKVLSGSISPVMVAKMVSGALGLPACSQAQIEVEIRAKRNRPIINSFFFNCIVFSFQQRIVFLCVYFPKSMQQL